MSPLLWHAVCNRAASTEATMSTRYLKFVLTGGAVAVAVMMLLVMSGGFLRLARSSRGEGSASGSSRDFMASTNKIALARELAGHGDVSAVSGLILGLRKDPDPAVRAACAEALGRIGDRRSMPDLAVRLIDDAEPAVRRAIVLAFEACRMHRDFGFFDALRKRLAADKSPLVRREIAGVLGRLATEEAMNALATSAGDADPGVRLEVVRAFAASAHEAAGRILAGAAIDPDAAVQSEASAALNRAGTLLLPHLREAVSQANDAGGRLAAVRLLPRPIAPEALPVLFSVLEKETMEKVKRDPGLHNAVVDALAGMGPDGAGAIAREAIVEEYAGTAEMAAAQACLRIGKPAARAIVDEVMKWRMFPDPAELAIWVRTLGEIGDPCAAPVLRRALAQGFDEMPAVVEKARCAIESKSATPMPAIEPEPGLLADAPSGPARRLRDGDMRFANVDPTFVAVPSNGVLRLRFAGGMVQPDPPDHPGRADMDAELVRRDGVWDSRFPVSARHYSKRDHEGILLDVRETATNRTFVFDVLCYDDGWRKTAFGHFEATIQTSPPSQAGTYSGHMNFRRVSGKVDAAAYELPPHPRSISAFAANEHPRLIFREFDIPALREKARTSAGKRMLASIRRRIAIDKTLYRAPLDWVTNWEPGCNLAIAHGFMALLFDDPLYGRRSAPLIMDRTRTPPYGGEHGERMPGPMAHHPYAVDMNYRFLTPEERKEVVENRCWLSGLYNQAYGPLGVIAAARTVFGVPGLAALAMLREKGAFTLRQPDVPPVVMSLAGEVALGATPPLDPVNLFLAGSMPSNWLVAGPFAVEEGTDPLASIGGCEAAKPRLDTPVPVNGGSRKFRPLSQSAIQSMPPPFPPMQFIELPVSSGEQFFLYAILKIESRQGIAVEPYSSGGMRWSALWIDGRAMAGGTTIALEPGLHRVLAAVRCSSCSPTFPAANPEWGMALQRRHELLKQRWDDARKQHAETGELQDVAVVFDLLRQSIRSALWYETGNALSGSGRRGIVGHNLQFALACRAATGRGLDPDIPRPVLLPGENVGDMATSATDRDLAFMLGLAPAAVLPGVVREFDRRMTPDRFARLSSLEQIVAFVNYPVDLAK
jgi:HEAT repeat protein